MMSEHMSLNIMYSQCFRFYGVCHQWEPFACACGGVLYELHQAGHNFSKLHEQMCRFFKRHRPLYQDVNNFQVHQLARVMFEHYCRDGSPLLDHRNAWCGFEQRHTTLTEIRWPVHPRVAWVWFPVFLFTSSTSMFFSFCFSFFLYDVTIVPLLFSPSTFLSLLLLCYYSPAKWIWYCPRFYDQRIYFLIKECGFCSQLLYLSFKGGRMTWIL